MPASACNQDVYLKYAMVDNDNTEIASSEEVFPDIPAFLCDFTGSSLGTGNCSSDS